MSFLEKRFNMSTYTATRFLLTAGVVATLLPSCRIVNGRLDFFWIQEQFTPAIEDSVVVDSTVTGATPYVAPGNVNIPAPQPTLSTTQQQPTPAATPAPVAHTEPATTASPATATTMGIFSQQQAPAPAPAQRTYVVAKGDTLSGIAHKHRISLRELLQANGIAPDKADTLRDGQILNIPNPTPKRKARPARKAAEKPTEQTPAPAPAEQPTAQTGTAAPATDQPAVPTPTPVATQPVVPTIKPEPATLPATPTTTPAPATNSTSQVYTVLKGDTMSGIARKHGITISALLQANGIAPEQADTLRDGQTLNIPTPTR